MGTENNKTNCLYACGEIVLSHIAGDSKSCSNPVEKKCCGRYKTHKSTLSLWGFPNRRVGLIWIRYLSWVAKVYSHYAINFAYQSSGTYSYTRFIDEEVRTMADGFSNAASL